MAKQRIRKRVPDSLTRKTLSGYDSLARDSRRLRVVATNFVASETLIRELVVDGGSKLWLAPLGQPVRKRRIHVVSFVHEFADLFWFLATYAKINENAGSAFHVYSLSTRGFGTVRE